MHGGAKSTHINTNWTKFFKSTDMYTITLINKVSSTPNIVFFNDCKNRDLQQFDIKDKNSKLLFFLSNIVYGFVRH